MKRKLVFAGVSYLAGLFSASFICKEMYFAFAVAGIILVAAMIIMRKKPAALAVMGICFIAGLTYFTAYWNLASVPLKELTGSRIAFDGRITEADEYEGGRSGYHVRGKINGGITARLIIYADSAKCKIGDGISFEATLENLPANTYLTPLSYHESNGVFARAEDVKNIRIIENAGVSLVRAGNSYREYISGKIRRYLPGEEGALLTAMLCGDKSGLSEASKTNLYRLGIGHLTAVSGAHMMIMLMLLWCFFPKGKLPMIVKDLFMTAAVILFSAFAGFSPSVLRAGFLILMLVASDFIGRKPDFLTSLVLAAVVLSAGNPAVIWNPSFVLSFTGTWGVGCLAPEILNRIKSKGYFKEMLITGFSASFAAIIPSALYFPEVSPLGPLFAVVITPLCTAALFCGLLIASTGGVSLFTAPLLIFAGLFSKMVLYASRIAGLISFLTIPTGEAWVVPCIIIVAGMVIFAVFKFRSLKDYVAATAAAIVMIYSGKAVFSAAAGDLAYAARFSDSLVICSKESAVIIDSGEGRDFYRIRQYLQSKGVTGARLLTCGGNDLKSEAIAAELLSDFDVGIMEADKLEALTFDNENGIIYEYNGDRILLGNLEPGTELVFDGQGDFAERRARYACD